MEKNSVRFGLMSGLGVAIYQLLLYFIDAAMIFGTFAQVAWLIYLFGMWKATSLDKAENGGYISFKEAFTTAFTVFTIAALFAVIFQHFLTTVVDPGLLDIQTDIALESFDKMAGTFGIEEGSPEYEEALEEIRNSSNTSISKLAIGYVFILIFGSIPALIMGAVMKKEAPAGLNNSEEEEEEEEEEFFKK